MIATWMLYCTLCALGFAAAAALAERTLLAGRGPVRSVWIAAVALSVLIPALAWRFAPQPVVPVVASDATHDVTSDHLADGALVPPASAAAPGPASAHTWEWRPALARLDAPLAVLWAAMSLAVTLNVLAGVIALAWMRRGWRRRTILGVPVYVSARTGPAVVGLIAPAIVVPDWVTALAPAQLALLLRHEQEHRRAGDGRLLAAAELALIAMPWNLALWWQVLRLRVAVELDCDARVLQGADARSYGDLLLEVARPRWGLRLMGATAFAERATQLERRIRLLSRHRTRTTRLARGLAAGIGVVAATVAWSAPRPAVPARVVPAPVAPRLPNVAGVLPTATDTAGMPRRERGRPAAAQPRTATRSTRILGDSIVVRPVEVGRLIQPAPCGPTDADAAQATVNAIFDVLFEGIALTRDQAARACDILMELHRRQVVVDQTAQLEMLTNRASTVAARIRRDSVLRALLTNDDDRATLDARLAETQAPGARSGGPPPDWSMRPGMPAGRGRGSGASAMPGGGGRGGRSGGAGVTALRPLPSVSPGAPGMQDSIGSLVSRIDAALSDATFHRLFDGIALTTDQESSARTIIAEAQMPFRRRLTVFRTTVLRWNPSGTVSMQAAGDSLLMAVVSNDADRATLRSRIVIVP